MVFGLFVQTNHRSPLNSGSCNFLNLIHLPVFLGQLEWVNNLRWPGQDAFINSERQTLAVNSLLQGYFRETERLTFYWVNVAGQSVPTIYLFIKNATEESKNKSPKSNHTLVANKNRIVYFTINNLTRNKFCGSVMCFII